MTSRADRRARRREALQLECAVQRQQLAAHSAELGAHTEWIDRTLSAVRKVSPVMMAAGVALSFATRAGGAMRLLNTVLPLLGTLRRLWGKR